MKNVPVIARTAGIAILLFILVSHLMEYVSITDGRSTLEYFLTPALAGPGLILALPQSLKSKKRSRALLIAGHTFLFLSSVLILGFMYSLFKYSDPFLAYLSSFSESWIIGPFIVNTLWLLLLSAGLLVTAFSGHLTLLNHGVGFMEMTYFFIRAIQTLDLSVEIPFWEYLQMGGLLYAEGIILGIISMLIFQCKTRK